MTRAAGERGAKPKNAAEGSADVARPWASASEADRGRGVDVVRRASPGVKLLPPGHLGPRGTSAPTGCSKYQVPRRQGGVLLCPPRVC